MSNQLRYARNIRTKAGLSLRSGDSVYTRVERVRRLDLSCSTLLGSQPQGDQAQGKQVRGILLKVHAAQHLLECRFELAVTGLRRYKHEKYRILPLRNCN